MRSFFPFILIALAIFVAGCVAYIAWELTSERGASNDPAAQGDDEPPSPDES